MPQKFLTNGPGRGSLSEHKQISPKPQLFIIKHETATTQIRLLCEISVPHWTTLGGQSNSMALETPGTFFFFFPKRSCSCFARAGGGKGRLQHLHSWSVGQREQSLPRRGRHWTAAESENNDVFHKHKHTKNTRQMPFIPAVWWLMRPSRLRSGKRSFSSCASSVNNVTIKSLGRWYGWPTQSAAEAYNLHTPL